MDLHDALAIGIDLGGTTFGVGVLAPDGKLVYHESHETPETKEARVVIEALVGAARAADEATGAKAIGVGVGIPGVVDPQTGHVFVCPNLHALDDSEVGLEMEQALEEIGQRQAEVLGRAAERHVWIHNDAYCATLAELRWGAGKDVENLLMLTLGTGIGGGVAMNNKVIRGPRMLIGEIGHLTLDPNGPKCGCGNHGCFEALAARDAIVDLAVRKIQEGRETVLMEMCGGDLEKLEPKIIADAAKMGDQVALEVMERIGFWIGVGICNAIVLCDPDMVVIGGGIAAAGDVLFEPIRRTVAARSQISRGKFDPARIVPAKLKNEAGVYGAAQLVWEAIGQG